MTSAWTGEAGALLARAVARHGGEAAWEAVRRVTFAPRTLNGMLPSLKGVGRTFSLPGRIDVFPHESRAVFHDYPEVGQRGVFTAGAAGGADGRGGAGGADGQAGAGGAGGQAGAGGAGGSAWDGGPDGADAGCTGSPGFGCILGSCNNDVGTSAVCANGSWGCPAGSIPSTSCGGCIGDPPPNYVCGDGGWMRIDATGAGGASGI